MRKVAALIFLCCIVFSGCGEAETVATEENGTKGELSDWKSTYDESKIEYVDIGFLVKNSREYKGKVVASVGQIYELNDSDIQFDTDDSNFFIELTCNMKNENDTKILGKGETVCFVGKVGDTSTYFGNDTLDINDCFIMARAGECDTYKNKIEKKKGKQKKKVSDKKKKDKKNEKKKENNEKQEYMNKCKTYSYNSIKRNPDKYKGKQTKLSGKVIQVDEGWFDTVSMRVEDANGNDWFVSYSYYDGEDKILENDKITVYGECDGTEQYTTVIGDTRRIPSIDAKYIK